MTTKPGRNDACPCGSGKKYKKCCAAKAHSPMVAAKPAFASADIPHALQTAVQHHNAGRLREAEVIYQQILSVQPSHADALHLLGLIINQWGEKGIAVELVNKAIKSKPQEPSYHHSLGIMLSEQSKLTEAITCFKKALVLNPDYAEAHQNLGNTLQKLGKHAEAIACFQKALVRLPHSVDLYCALGNVLKQPGELDAAVACFQKALALKPDSAEAYNDLGNVLSDQKKLDEAISCFQAAISLKPELAAAYSNLGNIFKLQGKLAEAIACYKTAISLRPDMAELYNNLGNTLKNAGEFTEGIANLQKALRLKPDYADAHYNLGNAFQKEGRLAEAEASYRMAQQIKPDYAEANYNFACILRMQGRIDEALTSFRRTLQIKPDYADAYCNLLFLYAYNALIAPDEYLTHARNWEQACVPAPDRLAAQNRTFSRPPLAGRRLKVGYVSGDYRQHAVSYFVEQLFSHHDRERIELFAYSNHDQRDAVTDRLHALAEHWVSLAGISDAAVLNRIMADGIDVLIDLSGHTSHNRLGVFARRAAPVQAHYLGYFASTGLTEMDYWIGDEILTPAETDGHFSERVWRLPRTWVCYDGKPDSPASNWEPNQDGSVWLGSFNNLSKLAPATLALWAKVLHALPEGKLLLKNKELSAICNRQRILDTMAGHGISSERIELQDRSFTPDWAAHMAYYDRLDIALDPVGGVGGGTTTCDALWMGVPVISLEGDRMASRMTASMLNAIGHPEWVACSEEEYLDKVVSLARDAEQRKALRSSQRSKMARSPLCDAKGLAVNLEDAYLGMFERWFDEKS